ncbi:hypothetical protein WJX72_008606 [[Myrmecia] bisecta]|uniref:very-long-chain 3-oxoacyl-CoA synthase n=1 Tax=[Myrmecia] bisecta TaxID=41462 RepID=A0AAW1P3B2_9CHLO
MRHRSLPPTDPEQHDYAQAETKEVLFTSVRELLQKANVHPSQVDIIVTNCSLHSPTPSMSSLVINHFGMRPDIRSFSLAGMGCSASVIALDAAQMALKSMPNSVALVLSTEIIGNQVYYGNERPFLVANCIFRMGGAAALLSNRPGDKPRAKYRLDHIVRTHMGANDVSLGCMRKAYDASGIPGMYLGKDILESVKAGLKATTFDYKLGHEPVKFLPNFEIMFGHICAHTGGRTILAALEKNLGLSSRHMQPAYDTLMRFGNTSSASTWYVLAHIETNRGVCKGDTVWQLAVGGGIKCNSAVWTAMRSFTDPHAAWLDG